MMKRLSTFITGIIAYLSFSPAIAFAQNVNPCSTNGSFNTLCKDSSSLSSTISNIVTIILLAAVLIAFFFLIWGGIKWILSGGDKSAVEGARNTIVAAIIGLAIAFLAFIIINLILYFFGIGTIQTLGFPKIF